MIIQRSIKKALQNPTLVTGLDLSQVKPIILLPEIEQFINLESIDLSNCTTLDWADACKKLARLPKLTEIKAFRSDVKELPAEFGLLTSLKKIDFSNNAGLVSSRIIQCINSTGRYQFLWLWSNCFTTSHLEFPQPGYLNHKPE